MCGYKSNLQKIEIWECTYTDNLVTMTGMEKELQTSIRGNWYENKQE